MLTMFEEPLTDSNFMMFAMKHYTNPECGSVEEFQEDMNRIKYLKRLFGKYKNTGLLKERLILNHIIIMYNIFQLVCLLTKHQMPTSLLISQRFHPRIHVIYIVLHRSTFSASYSGQRLTKTSFSNV